VAEEALVHPGGGGGVRLAHGGGVGPLRGALRRGAPRGVLRRDAPPDGGREAPALASRAGPSGAPRLRVRASGGGERVRVLRAEGVLASPGGHRAAHGVGLRLPDALAGGRALPGGREGEGGLGQPQHPHGGGALRSVRAGGGQADLAPVGVPPHAQARLVAKPGRDRVERAGQAQCLCGRRIPDKETLAREARAWERGRNERRATVEWRFTAEDAREKLQRLYPSRS